VGRLARNEAIEDRKTLTAVRALDYRRHNQLGEADPEPEYGAKDDQQNTDSIDGTKGIKVSIHPDLHLS
jgi:hypothetical protein